MRITGERVRRVRWIHTERYAIAVEVELVIPEDDSSEPCLEPKTVYFLKQVQEHLVLRDVEWLKQHGRLYQAVDTV